MEDNFVFGHILHFWHPKKSSVRLGKDTQCIRIGVVEDNFVFGHILHFGHQKKVQLEGTRGYYRVLEGVRFSLFPTKKKKTRGKNVSRGGHVFLYFLHKKENKRGRR